MKYRLPNERTGKTRERYSESRLSIPLFVLLISAPIAGYFYQGMKYGCWGRSLMGLAMGVIVGYFLWHALIAGQATSAEGSINDRRTKPFDFRVVLLITMGAYLTNVGALFLFPWP